jgi:hypothetical protein
MTLKHEVKGSMGSCCEDRVDLLDLLERINDVESRLHMIERKLCFIKLPNIELTDEEDIKIGGTD